jgi:hypothetical protein
MICLVSSLASANNCHIEILRNDAGSYHITGQGSVCIKYGVFTGEIHLSDQSRLEISPEAVFEGSVKTGFHTEIVNRGTWNASLSLSGHFTNSGPMYLKQLTIREKGVFTHIGPAKVLVSGEIHNQGTMNLHGLVFAEGSIFNTGSMHLKHAMVKSTENFVNKGIVHGGAQYMELASVSVMGKFSNHHVTGGSGEFLDVCAGSVEMITPLHPRVSLCAATPRLHTLSWLGMEISVDVQAHTLSWYTAETDHNKVYVVQKSLDGKHFRNLSVIDQGKSINQLIQHYQYTEEVPSNQEDVYYRIMSLNKEGEHIYSDVVPMRAISVSRNK